MGIGSNHLRQFFCKGAIFANAIPRSTLHPNISSAFVPTLVYSSFESQHRRHHSSPVLLSMTSSIDREGTSYIDKLALILINSKQEQLVARSYGKDVFYTPGGKREPGESDTTALVRECREELSVDLSAATLDRYGTFEAQAYGKPEGTVVRIAGYRVVPREAELELAPLVKANAEIEELTWIGSSFGEEKLTVTGVMILDDLKRKGLIA